MATFEEGEAAGTGSAATWSAPAPTQTVPISMIGDMVEVLVFDREGGPTLAGVIELVSPANKNRPEHREAFVSKCAAYLQQGIGLIVVDVVTSRRADLHQQLLIRLASPANASRSSSGSPRADGSATFASRRTVAPRSPNGPATTGGPTGSIRPIRRPASRSPRPPTRSTSS